MAFSLQAGVTGAFSKWPDNKRWQCIIVDRLSGDFYSPTYLLRSGSSKEESPL
jgi:hypothetical protein